MKWNFAALLILVLGFVPVQPSESQNQSSKKRHTEVSIKGEMFYINGKPTYQGRKWKGHKIEGLLFNSRMVQGIFDDLNPKTVSKWAYPDTGKWDPKRNTKEFIAAMRHRIGLNRILATIHIYPTLAEANKYVAGAWKRAAVTRGQLAFVEAFHQWMRGAASVPAVVSSLVRMPWDRERAFQSEPH